MNSIVAPAVDRSVLVRRGELVASLRDIVSGDRVIDGEQGCHVYAVDAYGGYRAVPLAAVIPSSVREVVAIMRFCNAAGVKIYPRGAGTSMTGGAVASEDGVVLCMSRLNRVIEINALDRLARVEAGISGSALSRAAAPSGLIYAPDPGTRLASSVGGNIATNAGGTHGGRYGQAARHVLSMKFVTIDGEVIELGSGEEETSDYGLDGLIIGSEAQLGVVVEATVRLLPIPAARRMLALGFQSVAAALGCANGLMAAPMEYSAMELIDRQVVMACSEFSEIDLPEDAEALLFIEIEGERDELDPVCDQIAAIAGGYGPSGSIDLKDLKAIEATWRAYQGAFIALGRHGDLRCVDFSVPPRHLIEAMANVGDIAARYQLRGANLCRASEGTVRSVLFEEPDDNDMRMSRALQDIARMVLGLGGQIAAEHGIGMAKRDTMLLQMDGPELNLHQRLKSAFDPEWLLNHGKVYPLADEAAHNGATR